MHFLNKYKNTYIYIYVHEFTYSLSPPPNKTKCTQLCVVVCDYSLHIPKNKHKHHMTNHSKGEKRRIQSQQGGLVTNTQS